MSAAVQKELKEVGLPHARFFVEVETEADRRASYGADQVDFFSTPTPGRDPFPLSETASGGELSRVMLAIESVFVRADDVPVLFLMRSTRGWAARWAAFWAKTGGVGARSAGVVRDPFGHHRGLRRRPFGPWRKKLRAIAPARGLRSLKEAERPMEIARLFGSAPGADAAMGLRHARELLAASRHQVDFLEGSWINDF
jgi:DNA repair protein RecN (Recombination protein N)